MKNEAMLRRAARVLRAISTNKGNRRAAFKAMRELDAVSEELLNQNTKTPDPVLYDQSLDIIGAMNRLEKWLDGEICPNAAGFCADNLDRIADTMEGDRTGRALVSLIDKYIARNPEHAAEFKAARARALGGK